jgi:hypothetical protein
MLNRRKPYITKGNLDFMYQNARRKRAVHKQAEIQSIDPKFGKRLQFVGCCFSEESDDKDR